MNLNLTNPMVFFDLESTGINTVNDRIVEISIVKVFPDGKEEVKTRRINPGMHIPEESTAIHGITDEDVKDCPSFRDVAKSLAQFIEGCDLAGFNSNRFDIPMLAEEFLRAGVDIDLSKCKKVDVQTIFHKLEQRTLIAAYKFYCGKDLNDAHSAEADTRATYEVLKAQLDRYPEVLENDVDFLAKYSSFNRNYDFAGRMIYNDDNEVIINFGKYKGRLVRDVLSHDRGYYEWMQRGTFALDTKQKLKKLKEQFEEEENQRQEDKILNSNEMKDLFKSKFNVK